jgi:hypothetical protein
MYGVPGEAMSNIHANNIQHSKHFNSHNQLESSRIRKSGNSRAIAQLSGHVLASSFSRRLVRRNSEPRRRVRGVGDLPWYSIVFGRSNARRATS